MGTGGSTAVGTLPRTGRGNPQLRDNIGSGSRERRTSDVRGSVSPRHVIVSPVSRTGRAPSCNVLSCVGRRGGPWATCVQEDYTDIPDTRV